MLTKLHICVIDNLDGLFLGGGTHFVKKVFYDINYISSTCLIVETSAF